MILVIAFAIWSLILTAIATATGMMVLMQVATSFLAISVGLGLFVLIAGMRVRDPLWERNAFRRGLMASRTIPQLPGVSDRAIRTYAQ